MDTIILILNFAVLIGVGASILILRNTLTSYASEKGRNLATKEDIEDITQKIETIKVDLQRTDRIDSKKYEMKLNACSKLLTLVDAQLSHIIRTDNSGNPVSVDKQYATEIEVRQCHNELILTIDNSEIIRLFLKIFLGKSPNPIIDLGRLRNMIRAELGFGASSYSDSENTWVGIVAIKQKA